MGKQAVTVSPSNLQLYENATQILDIYKKKKDELIGTITDIALCETNVRSERARIAREYDNSASSKAALNDLVSGHNDVLIAEQSLREKKARKDALKASMEYLKMKYDLEKKMMDSNNTDKKYLGG